MEALTLVGAVWDVVVESEVCWVVELKGLMEGLLMGEELLMLVETKLWV